jgi:hypothetical protein
MPASVIAERIAAAKRIEPSPELTVKVRQNLIRLGREGRVVRSGALPGKLWGLH